MKKPILLLLATLALASCISGTPQQSSYTSPTTGETTVIRSDKESCEHSCNESYNRCMDTQAASSSDSYTGLNFNGAAGGNLLGASAQCRNELSDCLPGCKSR